MTTRCERPCVTRCPNVSPRDGEPCSEHRAIDWPAFWRSLPPREAWEAAKAMPKIAGAWIGGMRHAHDGNPLAWDDAFVDADGDIIDRHVRVSSVYSASGRVEFYPDRASADAALRAAGWILVDEEGGQ